MAKAYCFKCKKSIDFKDIKDTKLMKRKLKNGLTTKIMCGECSECGGKVCSIIGNEKTKKKVVKTKK